MVLWQNHMRYFIFFFMEMFGFSKETIKDFSSYSDLNSPNGILHVFTLTQLLPLSIHVTRVDESHQTRVGNVLWFQSKPTYCI